jgi:hypothetical protein
MSPLSDLEVKKFDYKLNITNPPLSNISQENVDRFAIALCFKIPYPLLDFWHRMAGKMDSKGDFFITLTYLIAGFQMDGFKSARLYWISNSRKAKTRSELCRY